MRAYLFPGFDSLENADQRRLSLQIPAVRAMVFRANEALRQAYGQFVDLERFILSSDDDFNRKLDLKIAASIVVQTAVFETLKHELKDEDLIVGCSLGDLARSVCSSISSFEEVLLGGYRFGSLLMKSKLGSLYRCTSAEPISLESLQASLPEGLYISVYQTPRHFLIASASPKAEAWLKELGIRYSVLAEIPLHSPLMSSVLPLMETTIRTADIRTPSHRVFSSLWHKELACPDECAQEVEANIVACVDWVKTLECLATEYGVRELVSVGPAPTLLRFAERTPATQKLKMRDAYAQLSSGVA